MAHWMRAPFDADLLSELVAPAWRAIERGWSEEALAAAVAIAERVAARDPADAAAARAAAGEWLRGGDALASVAEELSGDPAAPALLLQARDPGDLRALLLMLGWHRFEPAQPRPDLAARVMRGGKLAGLPRADECVYGICPLIDACELGPLEPSGAPPAGARLVGEILGLDGEDWREIEPFNGAVLAEEGGEGWLYLRDDG